jgi:hypothetical protein
MQARCLDLLVVVTTLALLGSCHHATEIYPSPTVPLHSRWNGTIESPQSLAGAIQIHGSAWIGPISATDSSRTTANISIANAAANGVHPWAVRQGQCGTDQGPFGSPADYPPLKVQGDGTARAHATLQVATPSDGQYYIYILAAPNNTGTIIACGNLATPLK